MSVAKPFFVQQLIDTTHLLPSEFDLRGVRKLLGTRIRVSAHPGSDPEVSLMAMCAARQLGMGDDELGEWTVKFCENVMRNSVTPGDVDREIGTILDSSDRDAFMPWFTDKASRLGIRL